MRKLAVFGTLAFAVIALDACGGASHGHGIPAGAVVAVEGKGITEEQLRHRIAVTVISASAGTIFEKGAVAPDPPRYEKCIAHLEEISRLRASGGAKPKRALLLKACQHQYEALLQEALSSEITSAWEFAEGAARGLSVSEAEVDKRYQIEKEKLFPTQAKLEHLLASTGQTVADLRLTIKRDLLNEKIQHDIVAGKVNVTQAEIEKYYHANQSQFGPTTHLDVRLIATQTKARAEQAKREVESGKSFASVAKKYSTNPATARKGGLFPNLARDQAPPDLEKAVFAAKPGVLGGPVKTFLGYWIYEVVDVKAHGAETLAQATPTIKERITTEKENALAQQFANEFKKRWTQLTECRPGFVAEQCKEHGASGTSTTTSTGG